VTGGAASLEVAPGVRLIDTPEFPEAWKGAAQGGIAFLDALKGETEIDWTFFSPPPSSSKARALAPIAAARTSW
jgi:putative NADH-flavin reductase